MTQDLRVALVTTLNDRLVAPLRRSLDEMEKHFAKAQKDLDSLNKGSATAAKGMTQMAGTANQVGDMLTFSTKEMEKLAGGSKSAAEGVDGLSRNTRTALGLAERLRGAWSATGSMVNAVTKGVAAYQAVKMITAAPLQTERSYSRQLADAANTAFADRDTRGRQLGMKDLDETVKSALRAGGGKREDALAGLNEMLASGVVNAGQAQRMLPTVTRYATAGNASVTELSSIVVRAIQSGFKEADISKMLDMALAAGQSGGFELKDQAKWLPKLLAAGTMSGLGGMEGYARILASAQGSVTTAGSKDEAGNNLLNLLLKINSADTANDAKKLGIDLSGSLAAARAKGVNSLDAFVNLVEQVAGRDTRMVKLRKEANAAGNNEERKASLNSQADILQGSAIGKMVQDRQALLTLVAELNKKDYIQGIKRDVLKANGQFGASNFDLVSQTADYRINQAENEALFAQGDALHGVNDSLGKLAVNSADLYQRYPGYAQAIEAAKLALAGLAGAAGAVGLAGLLTGRAAAVKGAAAATAAAGAAGAGTAAPSGLLAGGAGLVVASAPLALTAGGVLAAGVGMSSAMNTPEALRRRADTRQARLNELTELADLTRQAGGSPAALERLEGEIAAMRKDRDDLLVKQVGMEEVTREIRALANRPIQLSIDGTQITSAVNDRNASTARRN